MILATETLTSIHKERESMDEASRSKIERYAADLETIEEQLKAAQAASQVASETRRFHDNRVGKLEFEKWVIMKNIERIAKGQPEIPWPHEGEPSDYTDYSHH